MAEEGIEEGAHALVAIGHQAEVRPLAPLLTLEQAHLKQFAQVVRGGWLRNSQRIRENARTHFRTARRRHNLEDRQAHRLAEGFQQQRYILHLLGGCGWRIGDGQAP